MQRFKSYKSNLRIPFLLITLLLVTRAMFSFQVEAQSLASMNGKWTLTTVRDRQKRQIIFDITKGQLGGYYLDGDQKRHSISEASLNRGSLKFSISDLGLHFEMEYLRTGFEGRMFSVSKKTPDLVKLSKVQ